MNRLKSREWLNDSNAFQHWCSFPMWPVTAVVRASLASFTLLLCFRRVVSCFLICVCAPATLPAVIESDIKPWKWNDSDDQYKYKYKYKSNQSINSIYMLTFFGKSSISLPFFWKTFDFVDLCWHFWDILNQFNWFYHTSPSKSIDSVTYFMKANWLSHQSNHAEKELNRISQFFRKMNRFKSVNSVELIGTQICLLVSDPALGYRQLSSLRQIFNQCIDIKQQQIRAPTVEMGYPLEISDYCCAA